MKKIIAALAVTTFLGCRNTPSTEMANKETDTIKTETDGVAVVKPDSTPVKKTVKKDTIRNDKDTQMSEAFFQKAMISLRDSSLTVYENIRADYRIFGYQKPDTNSRKMILFSVFTSDVENNPYKCPFGAYYYSGAMHDTKIKYVKQAGAFVEAHLIKETEIKPTSIYILKDWVEFDERN
ncbi:hypothetical protein SAMN05421827_10293 [Pedobacter terrae]|uniref:Uncharacterized protein n=1 Tax=Pedobacter terrae TaxID=405671 RepID=A0A1G7Q124_9SPHI|nr:hypothetical protein [Pedobacter terrae]SDF91330.1 hypothetical protein SAMN05421827_10293 [Pedobacter terrae]